MIQLKAQSREDLLSIEDNSSYFNVTSELNQTDGKHVKLVGDRQKISENNNYELKE